MPTNLVQFMVENGTSEAAGIALAAATKMSIGKMLPVSAIGNIQHVYSKETSLGGVSRRVINKNFEAVQGSVVTPAVEPIAILGRQTQIDVRLARVEGSMSRANEHARAGRAIGIEVDDLIFNGDRQKNTMDIDGLGARCDSDGQTVYAGNNGGAFTLDLFHELIDAVDDAGAGRDVYMSKTLHREFKNLVLAEAGGASLADVSSEVITYEGVRVRQVGKGLDGKPLLDFDEKRGTSNITASIYCIAPGPADVELAGVRLLMASNSIEIIENGTVGSFVVDQVEFGFGLAVYDKTAAARLAGITKAA